MCKITIKPLEIQTLEINKEMSEKKEGKVIRHRLEIIFKYKM